MLYTALTGQSDPYPDLSGHEVREMAVAGTRPALLFNPQGDEEGDYDGPAAVRDGLQRLVTGCTERDPALRLQLDELIEGIKGVMADLEGFCQQKQQQQQQQQQQQP
jgi:hypothetical protein